MDASAQITKHITGLSDWRGKALARLRKVILKADPEITEEWKWGTPVFSHSGLVCGIGAFKDHVGLNFFKGAALKDPRRLFNGGLEAKASRSINLRQGDAIDEAGVGDLVRAAVALNVGGRSPKLSPRKARKPKRK
jgi:hypothetical protein